MKKIDRREFLKASAGTALLAAGPAILTGCADSDRSAAVDLHMHLQRQKLADRMISMLGQSEIYGRPIVESNGQLLISHLDKIGSVKGFAFSAAYIWGSPMLEPRLPLEEEYEEVKAENNWAVAQAAEYPDRLVPFFSVNPFAEYAVEEMERCKLDLGISTMKLHFGGSMVSLQDDVDLQLIKTVFARAAALDIRIVIHFRNDEPDFGFEDARIFIDEILGAHPDLKVQLAHLGSNGGFDQITESVFGTFIQAFDDSPELKKERLFFDLSFVILQKPQVMPDGTVWREATTPEQCERLVAMIRRWGIENVFWGSDFFMADPFEYYNFTRRVLPLSREEWNIIMNNEGEAFWA